MGLSLDNLLGLSTGRICIGDLRGYTMTHFRGRVQQWLGIWLDGSQHNVGYNRVLRSCPVLTWKSSDGLTNTLHCSFPQNSNSHGSQSCRLPNVPWHRHHTPPHASSYPKVQWLIKTKQQRVTGLDQAKEPCPKTWKHINNNLCSHGPQYKMFQIESSLFQLAKTSQL